MLTLQYFLPFLKDSSFIVCHRDPISVEQSLSRRGWFLDDSLNPMTLLYRLRLDDLPTLLSGYPTLHVSYEAAKADPARLVDSIINFLGLEVSVKARERAVKGILTAPEVRRLAKLVTLLAIVRYPWKLLQQQGDSPSKSSTKYLLRELKSPVREASAMLKNLVQPTRLKWDNAHSGSGDSTDVSDRTQETGSPVVKR